MTLSSTTPLGLALEYLRRHAPLFVVAVVTRCSFELMPMQIPIITGAIVDGLSGRGLTLYGQHWGAVGPESILQVAVIALVAVAVLYGLSAFAYTVTGALLGKGFVTSLRRIVFAHAIGWSLDLHRRSGSGGMLDRLLRDTGRGRSFLEKLFIRSITNAVRIGYPLAMMLAIDPVLTLIALSVIPPHWAATWVLQRRLRRVNQENLDRHAELTTVVKENLDGVETLQGVDAEGPAIARMTGAAERVEQHDLIANRLVAGIRSSVWIMTGLGFALVWWLGGLRVLDDRMTPGTLIVFAGLTRFAYLPFRKFTNLIKTYRRSVASLERIGRFLATPSTIAANPDAEPLRIEHGRIRLENVRVLGLEDATILSVDALEIPPGQITAMVGPSGSGKSTLLGLIARLTDPDQGHVLIDGQSLDRVALRSVRSQVARVPQWVVLFEGTVRENLTLGRPEIDDDQIRSACQTACATALLESAGPGLDGILGADGLTLSGGQAQRLAIARALLTGPRILLMDEPTSALDPETEAEFLDRLRRDLDGTTIVIAAHREATVAAADHVVVLQDGRVLDHGPTIEVRQRGWADRNGETLVDQQGGRNDSRATVGL